MTTNKSQRSIFYGWVVVAAGSVILLLAWGFQYSYGVFFTELCDDLNWTRTMVSGAYSLFFLWHSITYLASGRLNDRHGPRLTLAISIIALSIGYALMSIINVPWQLYAFYGIIIGTGAGFAFVPVTSTVSRWFVERRGMVLGITVAGIGIGTLILAPFTQFLIFKFDWRMAYLIVAGLIFVIGFPISRLMRLHPSEKGLLPYGMKEIEGENRQRDGSLGNTVDFSFKQAINTKAFRLLCVMYMFLVFSVQMIMVHLKAHATDVGITPMVAATTIGIIGGGSILGRITMGSVSDKVGRKVSFFIAFFLMAVMMLWLLKARQVWQFYLFSAIFGFGYGSNVPLFPAITADWFGTKAHGIIFGAVSVAGGVGGAIGPLLAGYIFDAMGRYDIALVISAVLLFIAAACSFLIKTPYQS